MDAVQMNDVSEVQHEHPQTMDLHVSDIDSAAIQRLVREVSADEQIAGPHGYNRTYNRHNR